RKHDLLPEVRAKGLRQALDGWEKLDDTQTHFVQIDIEDGRYEIQSRHHDGYSGLSGPTVLHDVTTDRQLVARRAAALVERGFGVVGTVNVKSFDDPHVDIALRGGGLGALHKRWLSTGDVLTVARLTGSGEQQRSTRIDWALLQVETDAGEGVYRC